MHSSRRPSPPVLTARSTRRGVPWTRAAAVAGLAVCLAVGVGACSSTPSGDAGTTTVPVPGTTATSNPAGTSTTSKGTTTTAKASTTSTTTTTKSSPSTTTTAVQGPTTTATTVPSQPTTAEGFARALYAAWQKGDKEAAAAVATPGAIATLFAITPDAAKDRYTFKECTGAAGSEICRLDGTTQALMMKVRNETGGLSMLVTEVKFLANEA